MPLKGLPEAQRDDTREEQNQVSARRRRLRPRWWLSLVVALALVVVAEVALQFLLPAPAAPIDQTRKIDASVGWRALIPNSVIKRDGKSIPINDLGLRGAPPNNDRIQVGVIGADTVFNSFIENEKDTLSELIERKLNLLAPRFDVVNAGVPGLRLSDVPELMAQRLLSLDLRALVIVVGFEDLLHLADAGKASSDYRAPNPAPTGIRMIDLVIGDKVSSESSDPSVELLDLGLQQLVEHVDRINSLAEEAGIGVLYVTEPSLASSRATSLARNRDLLAQRAGMNVPMLFEAQSRIATTLETYPPRFPHIDYADIGQWATDAGLSARDESRLYEGYDDQFGIGLSEAGIQYNAGQLFLAMRQSSPWMRQQPGDSLFIDDFLDEFE